MTLTWADLVFWLVMAGVSAVHVIPIWLTVRFERRWQREMGRGLSARHDREDGTK